MSVGQEHMRTARLLGEAAIERLHNARVAVFGIGGVGGYTCEALARAGVGHIDLFDNDTVSLSNLNRQIVALHSTVGMYKTDVMRDRILDINPSCDVRVHHVFYLPENADEYPLSDYDCVADAIDTVSAKVELAVRAHSAGIPLISSMGTGNKLDPTRFAVTDLAKTEGCPLARVMRYELKKRGIKHLKVVYSTESPAAIPADAPALPEENGKRTPPGSLSFVPSVAGLILAGEMIKELLSQKTS